MGITHHPNKTNTFMQSSVLGLRNPYTQLKAKQLHDVNKTVKKQQKPSDMENSNIATGTQIESYG